MLKDINDKYNLAKLMMVSRQAAFQWIEAGHLPHLRAVQMEYITDGKYKALNLIEDHDWEFWPVKTRSEFIQNLPIHRVQREKYEKDWHLPAMRALQFEFMTNGKEKAVNNVDAKGLMRFNDSREFFRQINDLDKRTKGHVFRLGMPSSTVAAWARNGEIPLKHAMRIELMSNGRCRASKLIGEIQAPNRTT